MRNVGRWLLLIPFCVLSLGCSSEIRVSDATYLAVIDSVARTVPAGSRACFSLAWYPEGRQPLPGSLRDSLLLRGWAFHDPAIPLDTAALLGYIAEARPVEESLAILAGISGVYETRDGIAVWGEDLLFKLTCGAVGCRVTGVEDRTHWDATASRDKATYLSEGAGTCQSLVPVMGTGDVD